MIAKDPHTIQTPTQTQGRQTHLRVFLPGVAFLLLVALVSLSCDLFDSLKGMRVVSTDQAQIDMTQSSQSIAGTLSVFATQTAEAEASSATSAAPTAFPTFTPTQNDSSPTPTGTLVPADADSGTQPTTTPETPAGKIRFAQGATSATVRKLISAGEKHHYLVRALEGQFLLLALSSPEKDVYLGVKGMSSGQILLDESDQATNWDGRLPASQEYLITVTSDNADTDYFLSIEVPSHIYFDVGAYSDTIEGYIKVNKTFHPEVLTRVRYRARAAGGQTMKVELNSSNLDDLSVGIVGQDDGETYLDYEVANSGGEIVLPSDQAYFIDVYAVNGISTEFTLVLTIK